MKDDYYKICGQAFWELISDNDKLYLEIIKPLNYEAKKRSEEFQDEYLRVLSEFVIEGVKTTIPFHLKLLQDPNFRAGNFTTKFMARDKT